MELTGRKRIKTEDKRSKIKVNGRKDCFVALLLAMTVQSDESPPGRGRGGFLMTKEGGLKVRGNRCQDGDRQTQQVSHGLQPGKGTDYKSAPVGTEVILCELGEANRPKGARRRQIRTSGIWNNPLRARGGDEYMYKSVLLLSLLPDHIHLIKRHVME